MTLAALPFLAYYRLLHHHSRRDRLDPQVVRFVVTLVILSFLFAVWLHAARGIDAAEALTLSSFNIVSVVTTTGYASTDYLMWGAFAATLFFALTFVGGCTGSSTGAIKIFRFQVMAGMIIQHLRGVFHPHIVAPIRFGARTVTDAQVTSVGSFIFLYFLCLPDSPPSSQRSASTQRPASPRRQRHWATSVPVSGRRSGRRGISPRCPTAPSSSFALQ